MSLENTETGLTARLALAGESCDAFGTDINDLTIEVVYETKSRYVHSSLLLVIVLTHSACTSPYPTPTTSNIPFRRMLLHAHPRQTIL